MNNPEQNNLSFQSKNTQVVLPETEKLQQDILQNTMHMTRVAVQRSSGTVDNDWFYKGVGKDRIRVFTYTDKHKMSKNISIQNFQKLNHHLFGHNINTFKAPDTLQQLDLGPSSLIYKDKQGKEFYVAEPRAETNNGSRLYSILYTKHPDSNSYTHTVIYRSNSDGVWRATPGHIGGRFSKGNGIIKGYSYKDSTRLAPEVSSVLDLHYTLDSTAKNRRFTQEEQNKFYNYTLETYLDHNSGEGGLQFKEKTQTITFPNLIINGIEAGKVGLETFQKSKDSQGTRYLDIEEWNTGVYEVEQKIYTNWPDFDKSPIRSSVNHHSILGDYIIEVFPSEIDGIPVEWSIAHTELGQVWVDSINIPRENTSISDLGILEHTVNSGIYSLKPIEYTFQVSHALQDYINPIEGTKYSDITPLIDRLGLIQNYREARQIYRQDD